MNPSESRDPAWGLMQITPVVQRGFNKRYRTNYAKQDLLNPEVNVQIASDLLNRIVRSLKKFHTDPNLQENWNNPEFVALMVASWNSGYSEAGGLGRTARYLEERGIPVTHSSVFAHAGAAGATRHLQNPAKQRWQRDVVDLYFQSGGPGRNLLTGLLLLSVGGFVLWRLMKR